MPDDFGARSEADCLIHSCGREDVYSSDSGTGNAFPASYITVIIKGHSGQIQPREMTARKTIRALEVSLALVALLVFATVVATGWHHHDSVNDSHCPYCHLSHQAAGQPETSQQIAVLSALASLPLPEDIDLASAPIFS